MSLQSVLIPIIRSVFSRWTGLQLAVTHEMGGHESQAKYEAFIEAFGDFLTRNSRSTAVIECDIQQYLEEILDEEFNTELDDGSSHELAQLFHRYLQMIAQGKLNEIQNELTAQQNNDSGIQMSVRNENDDSSSESEDSDDDMITEEPETEKPKKPSMETDEDGWTTIHRRR